MGKKSRSKRTRQNANVNEGLLRSSPNWPLLAISILGMALTVYLTYTSLMGASVKGCSAGSGCDVVLCEFRGGVHQVGRANTNMARTVRYKASRAGNL